VVLSNKSFSLEASQLMAEKLKTFSNLKIANIADIIAGKPEEEALIVLKNISDSLESFSLVELDVSDNALGAKGVQACRAVLKCPSLEVRV
jgi:Ran GTPase-activating protein (RanGAP) involved in mRNA processing and transport